MLLIGCSDRLSYGVPRAPLVFPGNQRYTVCFNIIYCINPINSSPVLWHRSWLF